MNIAIDALGGDLGLRATIDGALAALHKYGDLNLILCGDRESIDRCLHERNAKRDRLTIEHAPEIIENTEHPVNAIIRKKNSSLVRALKLVVEGKADCIVSAGSTGALLAGATLYVKRIEGVKRPALAPVLPTRSGRVLLLDSGANVDCKPFWLQQFAVMGDVYMKKVCNVEMPRIGLLNNGTEVGKGNALTKETYELLEQTKNIHFVGNCEARDVMSGNFDVVVCDGFDGNAVLKATEGTALEMLSLLKNALMSSARTKIGAMLAKPAFKQVKKHMDYTEYGGAPFLGVKGGVIKAHGSSDAKAFAVAIGQARSYALNNLSQYLADAIARLPVVKD